MLFSFTACDPTPDYGIFRLYELQTVTEHDAMYSLFSGYYPSETFHFNYGDEDDWADTVFSYIEKDNQGRYLAMGTYYNEGEPYAYLYLIYSYEEYSMRFFDGYEETYLVKGTKDWMLIADGELTDDKLEDFKNDNYWDNDDFTKQLTYDFFFKLNNNEIDLSNTNLEDVKTWLDDQIIDYVVIDDNGMASLVQILNEDETIVQITKYKDKDEFEIKSLNISKTTPEEYSQWLCDNYWSTWADYEILP